jgi:hypothetical protein
LAHLVHSGFLHGPPVDFAPNRLHHEQMNSNIKYLYLCRHRFFSALRIPHHSLGLGR